MIRAAIVAGGRGERMRPATDLAPKPMLPVLGKPILEHQLDWLKAAGVEEVVLCLGYKAEAVRDYFGDGAKWGLKLAYAVEDAPRGTAGAVKDAAKGLDADLLVVYGDLFVQFDFKRLWEFHRRRDGAATLVLRESDHPQDSDLVELDGERVRAVYRAQAGMPSGRLALAAVWIVRPKLLESVPADRPSDFGREVFPGALRRGEALWGYRTEELVVDLGTPERVAAFEARWKR